MISVDSEMSWIPISVLQEHFQPKIATRKKQQRQQPDLNPEHSEENSWLLDIADSKHRALLAALETAETLSSVGTVLHIK